MSDEHASAFQGTTLKLVATPLLSEKGGVHGDVHAHSLHHLSVHAPAKPHSTSSEGSLSVQSTRYEPAPSHDPELGRADNSYLHTKPLPAINVRRESGEKPQAHPVFRRHAETTPSELFYDLFFVANLTAFTGTHEINDRHSLTAYIGFFCILWFTWLQIALFDLRFGHDSILNRVSRALQLGVMVGFAVVGYQFDPHTGDVDGKAFSLILMASRLVLCTQYLSAYSWTRHYAQTRLPLLVTALVCFISAMVFLGVSFAFSADGSTGKAYYAWYIVSVIETGLMITASSIWRVQSFKGTHIVQRMSLLTLIILGEGVIGLCQSIQRVWGLESPVGPFMGLVTSATLLLYFLYMLYFDSIPQEHFGTIRQQIWACLHFPLHLALVLAVEGSAQFIKWRCAVLASNEYGEAVSTSSLVDALYQTNIVDAFAALPQTESFWKDQATFLTNTFWEYTTKFGDTSMSRELLESVQDSLVQIQDGAGAAPIKNAEATISVFYSVYNLIFAGFGIETAGEEGSSFEAVAEQSIKITMLSELVFRYFFIATGVALVLIALMAGLGKRELRLHKIIPLIGMILIGIALALLSIMAQVANPDNINAAWYRYGNFAASEWVIPTVTISLFGALTFLHVPWEKFMKERTTKPKQSFRLPIPSMLRRHK